jgi:hypothetical protein
LISNIIHLILSSLEINRIGSILLGSKWIGVFPLDKVPLDREGGLVVNTQPSTLRGEHWLAVYITLYKINVFDPFGFYYPSLLVNRIETMNRSTFYNNVMYQDPLSKTCGQYCLLWLTLQSL